MRVRRENAGKRSVGGVPAFTLDAHDVIVCADRFGERENRLFLRLQDYASDVILLVAEWANQSTKEFGLSWRKGEQVKPYPEAA